MIIEKKDLLNVGSLELLAKQVVEGFITGMHKSPFHGFSVEFAEHRLYNPGESVKNIDWKLYGRTDKLFVKRYEEETNLRCQLLIDSSSSMLFPVDPDQKKLNKLQFSVMAAASIMEMMRKQRDAVGLSLFNDKLYEHIKARSGNVQTKRLLDEFEKLLAQEINQSEEETSAIDTIHQVAESIPKRSLVIIFSDLMEGSANQDNWAFRTDELISAMQHMKHKKHEVVLFHVFDKQSELDFEFENRPYKFVDLETGEEMKLRSKDVKEEYIKRMKEFYNEIQMKCGQMGVDIVKADINEGFEKVLLSYLLKRGKLY